MSPSEAPETELNRPHSAVHNVPDHQFADHDRMLRMLAAVTDLAWKYGFGVPLSDPTGIRIAQAWGRNGELPTVTLTLVQMPPGTMQGAVNDGRWTLEKDTP